MSAASVATDVVKYALAIAQTPAGHAAVTALGGPVADMIVQFGLAGVASVLSTWAEPTITEAQMAAELAKGYRVVPYDPNALFGGADLRGGGGGK